MKSLLSSRKGINNKDANFSKSSRHYKHQLSQKERSLSLKKRSPVALTPFEKIKLETDRRTAHGHPLILPSDYGEYGPVYDVIALFQNAVKKQILVAYDMLEVMMRYKFEVSHHHLKSFFDWFDRFEDSVLAIFDVEKEHVYPFLEEVGVKLSNKLSKNIREKACAEIFASLEVIAQNREKFRFLPAGEVIPIISGSLDAFLRLIVGYYNEQSKQLPHLIFAADIGADMETVLRSRFITALREKRNCSIYIPFVAHWLTERQLKTWKAKYLGPVLSLRFEHWARRYEALHGSIPYKIFESLTAEDHSEDDSLDVSSLFLPEQS